MKVGDLVALSAHEEAALYRDVDWQRADSDWRVGVIVEVNSHHGNPPFYQVYWTPANEVVEESHRSINIMEEA